MKTKQWLLVAFFILFAGTINGQNLKVTNNTSRNDQKIRSTESACARERILFDTGWRFAYGHPFDASKDFNNGTGYFSYLTKTGYGDGPAASNFDDRAWRMIDLPHDWAVELPFDSRGGHSHGYRAIGRNFPENSVGWYRKIFTIPASDLGNRIVIEFDGVHRNSIVWVNGFYLGQEHSGYSGFQYDITDYLNYGGENTIAVRVDATMEEGWYYEGAGIYRHVWLTKTSPLHIAPDGIFITTALNDNKAIITARTTIENGNDATTEFDIEQHILDANGNAIAGAGLQKLLLQQGETKEYFTRTTIENPDLWSPETPCLHQLVTIVMKDGKKIDSLTTGFGIRTVEFTADSGFFLNGKHVIIKGTNNHQDHAGVGTAIPDALQEFRVLKLKEMGSNAIRCSHNPATPELLEICDRLGMMVLDENRLMGINQEHFDLLERMIKRGRNHPCIIAWSLGNEEWAIESTVKGARITSTMLAFAQRLDSSRSFTVAVSGGWDSGTGMDTPIMGYNYIVQGDIDVHHAKFPWQAGLGTEESNTMGTRGIYVDNISVAHIAPVNRMPENVGTESGWKFYVARPFLSGLFYWTGFDYRGEPNPFGWPAVCSQKGIIDVCGYPKDIFYYLQSWWGSGPVLHIFPHWNWPDDEGKEKNVWIYSNCDEVELFLNNKSLGKKQMTINSHLEWVVKYEPGTLMAKGYSKGKKLMVSKIETTGKPAAIGMVADRTIINADGRDVSVITVNAGDLKNRQVPDANNEISFALDGPGRIIGVGNGDPSSHEPDKFIESVSQVKIENMKAASLAIKDQMPELDVNFDDSDWSSAFNTQGEYNVKASENIETVIIRGSFELPVISNDMHIMLYPKAMGEEHAVYINGHMIEKSIKRDSAVGVYTLDHTCLHEGKNVYAIAGKPLQSRFLYDNLNTDPGIIQVITPAPEWKRSLFSGLAQIIIQSTGEAGEVILRASSPGLKDAVLKIQCK